MKAIIVNSGCANACTGIAGGTAVLQSCNIAAKALGCDEGEILQASTGVIGRPLDVSKIEKGVSLASSQLSSGKDGFWSAANAIITTDKHAKVASAQFSIGGKTASVLGIAKGAGMINPSMATMLCFIFTDAVVEKSGLQSALKNAVADSFNSISVDGETSTNDCVFLFASGAAQTPLIEKGGAVAAKEFSGALSKVCLDLALEIVSDGEGATKLLEVDVKGAQSASDASRVARAVVNSLLVKCALFGGDPNWGRVASAAGASGANVLEEKTSISVCGVSLFEKGEATGLEKIAAEKMKEGKIFVSVDLGLGQFACRKWGCDLGHAYVDVNSKYST